MQNELIVFPTTRAIRTYISSLGDFDKFLPSFCAIGDFFQNSISTPNKTFINNQKRFLLLKKACANINLDKLAISKNFTTFLKQSEFIFRFFDELSSEMVDIQDLKLVDIYDEYIEHLVILENLLNEFKKELDEGMFVDKVNLANNFVLNYNYLDKFTKITIFISGYLTKFELMVLKCIAKYKDTDLIFDINLYNIDYLQKHFNINPTIDTQIVYNLTTNALVSSKTIASRNLQKPVIKGFSSRMNQVAFVKEAIYKMVNNGINPAKIVVVLPQEDFAELLDMFDDEKYFNFAMGRGIQNTIFYKKLKAIIEYLGDSNYKSGEKLKYYGFDLEQFNKQIKSIYNHTLTKENLNVFLALLEIDTQEEDLKEKIQEILYNLDILFFDSNEELMLSSGIKLLYEHLSTITTDDTQGGKVTVMGLLETRGVRFGDFCGFDGVIIVDFNDDKAPKKSVKDRFLSSKIKELASMPTPLDRQRLQKYFYQTLIANAKEVFVSYVFDEQNSLSRFAKEIFDETSRRVFDADYKEILYKSRKVEFKDNDYIMNIDLSKQSFSATSLKTYLECKRKYFYKYIQKIKEHDISLMPKGYEIGTLVHKILQNLYTHNKTILNISQFTSLIDNEIAIMKQSTKNRVLHLELEIYKQKLKKLANYEIQRFHSGYKIAYLEKSFAITHNGICLNGVIDRVDEKDGKYYIIDYKTTTNLKVDTAKTYEKSSDFQLEFYYLGLNQTLTDSVYYYDLNKTKLIKEEMLDEKLKLLDEIFESLKTDVVNFEKTTNKQICNFCPYKIACGVE